MHYSSEIIGARQSRSQSVDEAAGCRAECVSTRLTAGCINLQHSATSPRASIFALTEHGVFGAEHNATKCVYNNLEFTVFLKSKQRCLQQTDNGRAECGYMCSRHSCSGVGVVGQQDTVIVHDLASQLLAIQRTHYSASNKCDGNTSGYSDISDY